MVCIPWVSLWPWEHEVMETSRNRASSLWLTTHCHPLLYVYTFSFISTKGGGVYFISTCRCGHKQTPHVCGSLGYPIAWPRMPLPTVPPHLDTLFLLFYQITPFLSSRLFIVSLSLGRLSYRHFSLSWSFHAQPIRELTLCFQGDLEALNKFLRIPNTIVLLQLLWLISKCRHGFEQSEG